MKRRKAPAKKKRKPTPTEWEPHRGTPRQSWRDPRQSIRWK